MKSVMNWAVAAAFVLCSAVGLTAQGPRGGQMTPEQRAEKMTRRMTEQLSLSSEQSQKIEQILLSHFKEMRQTPRRPAGDPSARPSGGRPGPTAEQRQKMAEHRRKMDGQIKGVLTDAQYRKWTEARAEAKARRGDRKTGHRPGAAKQGPSGCDSTCNCAYPAAN